MKDLRSTSYVIESQNGDNGEIDARQSISEYHRVFNDEYSKLRDRYDNISNEEIELRKNNKISNDELKNAISLRDKYISESNELKEEIILLKSELLMKSTKDTDESRLSAKELRTRCDYKLTMAKNDFNRETNNLNANNKAELDNAHNKLVEQLSQLKNTGFSTENQVHNEAANIVRNMNFANNEFNTKVKAIDAEFEKYKAEQEECIAQYEKEKQYVIDLYEPTLTNLNSTISRIKARYETPINSAKKDIEICKSNKEKELDSLYRSIKAEEESANSQLKTLGNDYKQAQKDFDRQIRDAKANDKPTTRLQQQKNSRLNKIDAEITKIKNNFDKVNAKYSSNVESVSSKYDRELNKLENELAKIEQQLDKELEGPLDELNDKTSRRDLEVGEINTKINSYKASIQSKSLDSVNQKKELELIKNKKLCEADVQLTNLASTIEIDLTQFNTEATYNFNKLAPRKETWYHNIDSLCTSPNETMEYINNKTAELKRLDYNSLINLTNVAEVSDNKVNKMASNKKQITITSLIISAVIILAGVLIPLITSGYLNVALAGISAVAGVACSIATIIVTSNKKKAEIDRFSEYYALANNYDTFECVKNQISSMALNFNKNNLYNIGQKLNELGDRENAIRKEYETEIDRINNQYLEYKHLAQQRLYTENNKIYTEQDNSIKQLNGLWTRLDMARDNVDTYIKECEYYNEISKKLQEQKNEIQRFKSEAPVVIEAFKNKGEELQGKLFKACTISDCAIVNDTHSILSDEVYLGLSSNYCSDKYGARELIKYTHNKKPIIVVYDELVSRDESSKTIAEILNDRINDIVTDMIFAFRFTNSRSSLRQFIIDNTSCASDLASDRKKKICAIHAYSTSIDDMKSYLKEVNKQREDIIAKGYSNIDTENEKRFENGDTEPLKYNIVYFVMKPDSESDSILENITLTNCDRFGFLPVFIISKKVLNGDSEGRKSDLVTCLLNNSTNKIIYVDKDGYKLI